MRTLKWKLNRQILSHIYLITVHYTIDYPKTRLLKFGQISFKSVVMINHIIIELCASL